MRFCRPFMYPTGLTLFRTYPCNHGPGFRWPYFLVTSLLSVWNLLLLWAPHLGKVHSGRCSQRCLCERGSRSSSHGNWELSHSVPLVSSLCDSVSVSCQLSQWSVLSPLREVYIVSLTAWWSLVRWAVTDGYIIHKSTGRGEVHRSNKTRWETGWPTNNQTKCIDGAESKRQMDGGMEKRR